MAIPIMAITGAINAFSGIAQAVQGKKAADACADEAEKARRRWRSIRKLLKL